MNPNGLLDRGRKNRTNRRRYLDRQVQTCWCLVTLFAFVVEIEFLGVVCDESAQEGWRQHC